MSRKLLERWEEVKGALEMLTAWIFPKKLFSFLEKEPLHFHYDREVSKNPLYLLFLVLTGYAALTIFFTYPLIINFSTAIPGNRGDGPIFLWNLWWMKYALLDLKTNPFYTDYIFYPKGVGLIFHTFTPLNGLISIPFQLLFGIVVANNIIIISSFILSAFGAYLLIDYLTSDKPASFIGGIIFAFCPYKFAHLLGHFNLTTTQWIPFYILSLIRLTREERTKSLNGIQAGLFLLFTALSDYYYFIFLGIFTILYLGYVFFSDKKTIINPSFFKGCIALFVTFIIGFLPVLSSAVTDIVRGEYARVVGRGGAATYVADLLGFFTPSVLHPVVGRYAWEISKHFTGNTADSTVFIGYTVILLASLTIIKFYRRNDHVRFWTLSLIVFLMLSLGLFPHILGREIKIPMPFFLINYLPVVNNMRVPSRLNIMMMLSFAVLSSFSLKFIFYKLKGPWKIFSATIVVMALISFEYLAIPFPMFNTVPHPIYEKLGGDKTEGAILDIPLGWRAGFKKIGADQTYFMYLQTIHHKQIFGGTLSRLSDSKIEYYRTFPIIKTIIKFEEGRGQPLSIDFAEEKDLAKDFISAFAVKYVVIHQSYLNTPVHQYITKILPLEKIYENAELIVYKTTTEP